MADRIDWGKLAEVIDFYSTEETGLLLHQFYAWIVDQLDDGALEPEVALEMGCGSGMLASKMVDWYPDTSFALVDSNAGMLDIARVRLEGFESATIHLSSCEAYLTSLPDQSADIAVYCRSWYALEDPTRAATEQLRVLRPGGMVFIYDFLSLIDLDAAKELVGAHDPERWEMLRLVIEDFNSGVQSDRYTLFDEASTRQLWGNAGAEIIAHESHAPDSPTYQVAIRKPA